MHTSVSTVEYKFHLGNIQCCILYLWNEVQSGMSKGVCRRKDTIPEWSGTKIFHKYSIPFLFLKFVTCAQKFISPAFRNATSRETTSSVQRCTWCKCGTNSLYCMIITVFNVFCEVYVKFKKIMNYCAILIPANFATCFVIYFLTMSLYTKKTGSRIFKIHDY